MTNKDNSTDPWIKFSGDFTNKGKNGRRTSGSDSLANAENELQKAIQDAHASDLNVQKELDSANEMLEELYQNMRARSIEVAQLHCSVRAAGVKIAHPGGSSFFDRYTRLSLREPSSKSKYMPRRLLSMPNVLKQAILVPPVVPTTKLDSPQQDVEVSKNHSPNKDFDSSIMKKDGPSVRQLDASTNCRNSIMIQPIEKVNWPLADADDELEKAKERQWRGKPDKKSLPPHPWRDFYGTREAMQCCQPGPSKEPDKKPDDDTSLSAHDP
jgi:hypothetical protein